MRAIMFPGRRRALRVLSACAIGGMLWGGLSAPASATTSPSPTPSPATTTAPSTTTSTTMTGTTTTAPSTTAAAPAPSPAATSAAPTTTAAPATTATDPASTATATASPTSAGFEVPAQLQAKWAAEGGAGGPLGQPISAAVCGSSYCYQSFEGGLLGAAYSSADGTWAAYAVLKASGATGPEWYALNGQAVSAWPLSDEVFLPGGSYQRFRWASSTPNALAYVFAPTGKAPFGAGSTEARIISGAAQTQLVYGPDRGPYPIFDLLGIPDAPASCALAGGGCEMTFGNGAWRYLQAPDGYVGGYEPASPIGAAYSARGAEQGELGYPVGTPGCDSSGNCQWRLEQADLDLYQGTPHVVPAAIRDVARSNALGTAVDDYTCGLPGERCRQTFAYGVVYFSAALGALAVDGAFYPAWLSLGGESGALGYPTAASALANGTPWQRFERGALAGQSSSVHVVRGAILAKFLEAGPVLGSPLGDEVCNAPGGGCYQWFDLGLIWWSSATGAHIVRNDGFRFRYQLDNWAWGPLGYPLGDTECTAPNGGCFQQFQGGYLWKDPNGDPAALLHGAIGAKYAALGWAWGTLGYPKGDEQCYPAGTPCFQSFDAGSIWWSPTTGAHMVRGAIGATWTADGWPVGLPFQDEQCTGPGGGCYQWFENGVYWWSAAAGTHYVKGGIKATYERLGWAWGGLGYALTDEYVVSNGYRQDFQGGSIIWAWRDGSITVLWP